MGLHKLHMLEQPWFAISLRSLLVAAHFHSLLARDRSRFAAAVGGKLASPETQRQTNVLPFRPLPHILWDQWEERKNNRISGQHRVVKTSLVFLQGISGVFEGHYIRPLLSYLCLQRLLSFLIPLLVIIPQLLINKIGQTQVSELRFQAADLF